MFKKWETVFCNKEFSNGGFLFKQGDEFIINSFDKHRITLKSKYNNYYEFVHDASNMMFTPTNYYWDYFYSEQELRRFKIEKILNSEMRCLKKKI